MSWSVNFLGRPEKVVEALKTHAEKSGLTGQSREEYEAAMPHLVGLVEQNVCAGGSPEYPKMVKLVANGHGSKKDGEWTERNCSVALSYEYTKVLV